MNLDSILKQIVELTSTLDPRTAAILFGVCAIGEFAVSVPYVLESIWLLAGYQLGAGVLSPLELIGLWLAAQAGRQLGTMALYWVAGRGSVPLVKWYRKRRISAIFSRMAAKSPLFNRINLSSPFSVAYGRFFGLRIPLTMALAIKKKPVTLSIGVMLSSLIWDIVLVALGMTVGVTAVLKPVNMLLYSLAGLTFVYLVSFILKRLIKLCRRQPARNNISA